jgi:hypothetical protein
MVELLSDSESSRPKRSPRSNIFRWVSRVDGQRCVGIHMGQRI